MEDSQVTEIMEGQDRPLAPTRTVFPVRLIILRAIAVDRVPRRTRTVSFVHRHRRTTISGRPDTKSESESFIGFIELLFAFLRSGF